MKEKTKGDLIIGGCTIVLTALTVVCAVDRAYHRGFQRGADVTFSRMVRDFPEIDFMSFWKKYHK